MKYTIIAIAIASFTVLSSCGSSPNEQSEDQLGMLDDNKKAPSVTEADAAIIHYLALKDALVQNDEKTAQEASRKLHAALLSLNTEGLSETQRASASENLEDMLEHAEHISEAPIDHQREHFVLLSEGMLDMAKLLGASEDLYLQHCPMANDNKGAYWLSASKDIKNPYFGAKSDMAKCGSLKEQIAKK